MYKYNSYITEEGISLTFDNNNDTYSDDSIKYIDRTFSINANKVNINGILGLSNSGLYWRDIDFPIVIRTTGTNIPTLTTLQGNITAPQWQVNDYNVCEGQELVHEWKEGSSCYWHCHIITNGVDTTNRYIKWEVEYFWVNVNGQISTTTIDTIEFTIPADTPTKTMYVVSISSFLPIGGKIGAHVYARLRRITSTGTSPSNDPWCTMLQMHVLCDTLGSSNIGTK